MAHASQGAAGGGAARAGARPACAGPASLSRAVRVRRAVSRHAGEIGRVQGGWALLGLALRLWAAWVRRDKQQAPGLLPWTPALAFVPAPTLALCLLGQGCASRASVCRLRGLSAHRPFSAPGRAPARRRWFHQAHVGLFQ